MPAERSFLGVSSVFGKDNVGLPLPGGCQDAASDGANRAMDVINARLAHQT